VTKANQSIRTRTKVRKKVYRGKGGKKSSLGEKEEKKNIRYRKQAEFGVWLNVPELVGEK